MKKILMLLALAGLSSAAMAQQKTEVVEHSKGGIMKKTNKTKESIVNIR